MSIKTLSPPVIGIGHLYYCWIWNNETNAAHISDCRNSMAFIFHIEYTQFMNTVSWNIGRWKSSRLRRKVGKGKYLFLLPIWENHFFIFLSCIFVNYKYLPEKRGKGTSLLDSTYTSEKWIDREKLYKRFLKFKYPPALDYKLDICHPLS